METVGNDIRITDTNGNVLADETVLTLGINDYIPAIYSDYFSLDNADIQNLTTAETLINYLKTINSTVDYEDCNRYFRY